MGNKSTSGSPPWNSLGAKPKSKSFLREMGGRVTGRTQRPEICDATGWPALSSRQSASSTPILGRTHPWTAAKGRTNNKPPQQPTLQLENRFAPLLKDPGSLSDDPENLSSSHSRVSTESTSQSKRLQGKLTTGPQTLIVGDIAVKDVRSICSKNTKVLCFPKDMVSDMTEKILHIAAAHPTVTAILVHTGANDVEKQQSETLKRDFSELLNTVSSLNAEVFISGPLPPVRGGDERFSRLLALNKWLSAACNVQSVHFIDNFNFFWDRRHFFKADGLNLNKSGVKLFTSNLFYFLRHPSVPSAKDKRQEKSKQEEEQTQHINLEGELPRLPPEESFDCRRHLSREEESPSPLPTPAPSTPKTPPRSPSSPVTLSPSSPLLDFTDQMNALVIAGTKLHPPYSHLFSPKSPKINQTVPSTTHPPTTTPDSTPSSSTTSESRSVSPA